MLKRLISDCYTAMHILIPQSLLSQSLITVTVASEIRVSERHKYLITVVIMPERKHFCLDVYGIFVTSHFTLNGRVHAFFGRYEKKSAVYDV